MKFKGLEKTSFIEWPGKAVSVAYTGGCNLRCPFCQNKDLVLSPESIPNLGEEELLENLKSRKRWIDALIVTGGEPTLHSDLPRIAKKTKEEGFEFGLETNGTRPEVVEDLIQEDLLDYIALDIKAPLTWKKYKKAIGVDNRELFENVKKTLEIIQKSEIDHECRTTAVPKILSEDDLEKIGKQLENIENFYLQQFAPRNTLNEEFEEVEPHSIEKIQKIKRKIENRFETCEIRNRET